MFEVVLIDQDVRHHKQQETGDIVYWRCHVVSETTTLFFFVLVSAKFHPFNEFPL